MTHGGARPRRGRWTYALVASAGVLLGVLVTVVVFDLLGGDLPADQAPILAPVPEPRATLDGPSADEDSQAVVSTLVDVPEPRERATRLRIEVRRWPDGRQLPGARVSVRAGDVRLLEAAATSFEGRIACEIPEDARVLDLTARADGYETTSLAVRPEDGERVVLALPPLTGFVGRVVLPTGEGVPAALVRADLYWPPRPALMQPASGGQPILTTTEGSTPAVVTSATNAEGYYYVEPCESGGVVDLALSVVGTAFASELVRVALPIPDTRLPDLVVRSVEPLQIVVIDTGGRPVGGTSFGVARGPAVRHVQEDTAVSDARGRIALPRHLSRTALSVLDELREVVDLRVDGLAPPVHDAWSELEADAGEFVVVLDEPARLSGIARDAANDAPLEEATATLLVPGLDGNWTAADRDIVRVDGTFDLRAPARFKGIAARLLLEAPGYADLETYASLEVDPDPGPRLPYHLSPVPGVLAIDVELGSSSTAWRPRGAATPTRRVHLRAWIAPGAGFEAQDETEPLTSDYTLVRDEWVLCPGEFVLRTMGPSGDRLALMIESTGEDGARFGTWGPRPISTASAYGVQMSLVEPVSFAVEVTGLRDDRDYFLSRAAWHPWSDAAWSNYIWVPVGGTAERRLAVEMSGSGRSFLELRLDRGPVSAALASMDDWFDPLDDGKRELRLAAPVTRSVQGRVLWYTEADFPDTAVALLGEPVDESRLDALGEHDWWTRPHADGTYRFGDVPLGDYLFVLYRPVGDEGVEVLGQRPVTVVDNLYQLEIWPETESSRGRVTIAR